MRSSLVETSRPKNSLLDFNHGVQDQSLYLCDASTGVAALRCQVAPEHEMPCCLRASTSLALAHPNAYGTSCSNAVGSMRSRLLHGLIIIATIDSGLERGGHPLSEAVKSCDIACQCDTSDYVRRQRFASQVDIRHEAVVALYTIKKAQNMVYAFD